MIKPCALLIGLSLLSAPRPTLVANPAPAPPLDHACLAEYARIPLPKRMPYGEVHDDVLAPGAKHFFEQYAYHREIMSGQPLYLTTRETSAKHEARKKGFAERQKVLYRADRDELDAWLAAVEAARGTPEFDAYGRCLRQELTARVRMLPDFSYDTLEKDEVTRALTPP